MACGPSISPCCGSSGVTIVARGASWRVVFAGGLIQTAVGRVSRRGSPFTNRSGWAAYFSYGSVTKARHDVTLYLYHTVRRFRRRRHKVAGPGYRQFPIRDVFGTLGVLSPESCPHFVRSALRTP